MLIYQSEKDLLKLKLSGHAYMSGSDTWVDLERSLGLSITQPDKIHLQETDDAQWGDMMQLLAQLRDAFAQQAAAFAELAERVPSLSCSAEAVAIVQELADCVQIFADRAHHVRTLFAIISCLNIYI